ncbi:30S ribosomal protein S4e [Candidatus Micrarchaeota archaeon]|nr:30S ribosomal protein S4e [Candidatus Micrarchaeota archaeon]
MGKRGGLKNLKRLAFPPIIHLKSKKGYTWVSKATAGGHNKNTSVPLILVIRDLLNYAETASEARKIVKQGNVLVDGRIVKNERIPVGIMDVITFRGLNLSYRLKFDTNGKFIAVKLDNPEDAKTKICKIVNKFMMPKGKIGITLHDGKTIIADNNVHVGDSVILKLPENKIKEIIKLQTGALCYIYKGKHIGSEAVLKELKQVKGAKKQVKMIEDGHEFYTIFDYIMAIKPGDE